MIPPMTNQSDIQPQNWQLAARSTIDEDRRHYDQPNGKLEGESMKLRYLINLAESTK
jgi:hypothetical protein